MSVIIENMDLPKSCISFESGKSCPFAFQNAYPCKELKEPFCEVFNNAVSRDPSNTEKIVLELTQRRAEGCPLRELPEPKPFKLTKESIQHLMKSLEEQEKRYENVVEVVRCKECHNRMKDMKYCTELDRDIHLDDYCSFAERRKNEHGN